MMIDDLPKNHFGAILADPPWHFQSWYDGGKRLKNGKLIFEKGSRNTQKEYVTLSESEIAALPIRDIATEDCVLFLWTCWPVLEQSLRIVASWGFAYKTCAFSWIKADATQMDLWRDDITPRMGLGYWTRANSEVCLLATRGKPKRLNADVRQAIIEPLREHSRKPDCIYDRIERLVSGPYLELFARQKRKGWTSWGNETDKFSPGSEWDDMWTRPFDRPDLV